VTAATAYAAAGVLAINGSQFTETYNALQTPTTFNPSIESCPGLFYLNLNDYVEFLVDQNSGATRSTTVGQMNGMWLHA
jgi:hypothetical protein